MLLSESEPQKIVIIWICTHIDTWTFKSKMSTNIKTAQKGIIMTLAKNMLLITALIWICYGGWLFIDPKGLSYAGFEMNHWSVIVEVQTKTDVGEKY